MPDDDLMTSLPILLRPDASRVVIRPFVPADSPATLSPTDRPRAQRIADRVLALDGTSLRAELDQVSGDLADRHRNVEQLLQGGFTK